jgi:RNA polymerase sigma factor (sigma-70 family)
VSVDAPAPDSLLAQLAAGGDDQAFAHLVRRHKEPLYRLLRRYTGDAEEAYEAVHEAFIAAWAALGRYDPERSFGAWLRTIAINKARDRGRRLMVRRLILGSRGLDDEALAAAASAWTRQSAGCPMR